MNAVEAALLQGLVDSGRILEIGTFVLGREVGEVDAGGGFLAGRVDQLIVAVDRREFAEEMDVVVFDDRLQAS